MMLWLGSRDNVVSTSDGRVNAHILERAPSAVQPPLDSAKPIDLRTHER
jgi:hypothetical protein